ncbi:MAG: hypothetical protein ABIP39_15085, partial [Polyangiaceae bacterium]
MRFPRASAFFAASVAAHLVVGALLFRSAAVETDEAPLSAGLAGETLSLPEDLVTEGVESPSVNAAASPAAPIDTPAPAAISASSPTSPTARARASSAAKGGAASSAEPGLYGAAGDRSASDLSGA